MKQFPRLLLAAGLLISLLAASIAPAAAQPNPPSGDAPFTFQNPPHPFAGNGDHVIYYPWVSNGEDFGLGESLTSISVQNLENRDGQVWIYRGDGNNNWVLATTAGLSAWASKTFSAAQLKIPAGEGAPVAVVGYSAIQTLSDFRPWGSSPGPGTYVETTVTLNNPHGQGQVVACVVNDEDGQPGPFIWLGSGDSLAEAGLDRSQVDGTYWVLPPWNQSQLQAALDEANLGHSTLRNHFAGLNADGDCNDSATYDDYGVYLWDSLTLGGTAFATATASDGAELAQIPTTHTATSGYNAFNGLEIDQFDKWYLPIAQTNCGPGGCWNSIVRIANLQHNNSVVTARFFPADDGSGSLQTGFQLQELVQGGETWNIDIGKWVPQGWVGAVHIYSDGAVFAMVDRYKAGTNMWITNTGSSANFEIDQNVGPASGKYVLYAPHVLVDYFGWNTGINVANLVERDNNVSIQFFNMLGNATQGLSQRLGAHGMTYFYDPSDSGQNWSGQNPATDPNAGIVASALITSDYPVAAVIDATKYPESDPRGGEDVFQAISYSATRNAYPWQAIPYVTKGNAIDGSGATSGINFMNPNPVSTFVDVYWVNPSGFNAANFGMSTVAVPAYANGFVYTLWQDNLPNGFQGAAVAIAHDRVPIIVASANVNYDVAGDGAVIYNGFNSCGFFRVESFRVSALQDAPEKAPRYDCDVIEPPDPPEPTGRLDLGIDEALLGEFAYMMFFTQGDDLHFRICLSETVTEEAVECFDITEQDLQALFSGNAASLQIVIDDRKWGLYFDDVPSGLYYIWIAFMDGDVVLMSGWTNDLEYSVATDAGFGPIEDSDYPDPLAGDVSVLKEDAFWDLFLFHEIEGNTIFFYVVPGTDSQSPE